MRIVDRKSGNVLKNVLILLTPDELGQLSGLLDGLDPTVGDHIHIDDDDYKKEITLAVYTPDNLHFFTEEIQKIINGSD